MNAPSSLGVDAANASQGFPKWRTTVGLISVAVVGTFIWNSLHAKQLERAGLTQVRDMRKSKALLRRLVADRLYVEEKYPKAVLYYSKALDIDRANVHVLLVRGMAYFEMGEWDRCMADCMRLLHLAEDRKIRAPVVARAYKMLGRVFVKLGHPNDAISALLYSQHYKPSRFTLGDLDNIRQNNNESGKAKEREGEGEGEGYGEGVEPNASEIHVHIEQTKQKGNGLVANRDFNVGDVVLLEEPCAAQLNLAVENKSHCAFCMKKLDMTQNQSLKFTQDLQPLNSSASSTDAKKPKRPEDTGYKTPKEPENVVHPCCRCCGEEYYCNTLCQLQAWLSYHRILCPRSIELPYEYEDDLMQEELAMEYHKQHRRQQAKLRKHNEGEVKREVEDGEGEGEEDEVAKREKEREQARERAKEKQERVKQKKVEAAAEKAANEEAVKKRARAHESVPKLLRRCKEDDSETASATLLVAKMLAKNAIPASTSKLLLSNAELPSNSAIAVELPPKELKLIKRILAPYVADVDALLSTQQFNAMMDAVRQQSFNVNTLTPAVVSTKSGEVFNGQSIYAVASTANHSCSPNTAIHFYGTNKVSLVATKMISKGEEVTIGYIDHLSDLSRDARLQKLRSNVGFDCVCAHCNNA